MNFTPTPMQQAAAEIMSAGKNLRLLSPTGSGKTLAFLLPLAHRLLQEGADRRALRAVVIVPTRELAAQIDKVFRSELPSILAADSVVDGSPLPLVGMALYGGRPAMDEGRVLRQVHPDVIFATPGRFLDHLDQGRLALEGVKTLIVDEYDKCLELGFREQLDRIALSLKHAPQVVLTSATALDEQTGDPSPLLRRKYETLDMLGANPVEEGSADTPAPRLSLFEVHSPERDKLETLARLLSHISHHDDEPRLTMVFVAHRESAERIHRYLEDKGFVSAMYHGGLEQQRRERALYRFRAAAASVMVCTDLAARGLDIPAVGHIVHYHLPLDTATFTHRSGRTARWDKTGNAYLLCGPEEHVGADVIPADMPAPELLSIDRQPIRPLRPHWTLLYIGRGKKDGLSRTDVLGFLCKKGGLKGQQIGRIDIAPHAAYAAVEPAAVGPLLRRVAGEKIKGMKTLIELLRH